MEEVALAMNARYRHGRYAHLLQSIDATLPCLIVRPKKSVSSRHEPSHDEYDGEPSEQKVALDISRLLTHWRQHGREQTYIVRDCSVPLSTGDVAVRAYVMPKYKLRFATERHTDMADVMKLALATTPQEIRLACLSRKSGTYDLYRHQYLRYTFVTIYVLPNGRTLDAHKNFGEQGGQTEHSKFIYGVENPEFFNTEPFALGPANSRPRAKKWHPKPQPKRSVALRKKLGPPLHESPQLPAELTPDGDAESSQLKKNLLSCLDAQISGEGNADLDMCDADGEAVAAPYDAEKCLGRVWNNGLLGQCKNPSKHEAFCGTHSKHLTHGRVDEPVPARFAKIGKRSRADPGTDSEALVRVAVKISSGSSIRGASDSASSTALARSTGLPSMQRAEPFAMPAKQPQIFGGRSSDRTSLKRQRPTSSSVSSPSFPAPPPATSKVATLLCRNWRRLDWKKLWDAEMQKLAIDRARRADQLEKEFQAALAASLESDASVVRARRERVERVQERLRPRGLQRQYTPPHGDCQFIAVARSLGFPDDAHWELRQEVVTFLTQHAVDYEGFQADGWHIYIQKLAKGAWGDQLCLTAMSRMFGIRFIVISDNEEGTTHTMAPDDLQEDATTIVLAHYGEIHYESTAPLLE